MARSGRHGADEAIAVALATGQTAQGAADAAGVGVQTVWRRLRNPAFKARVAELRAQMVSAATGKLADGMGEAAEVLRNLIGDTCADGEPRSEKIILGAAVKLLELSVKLRDSVELEERLSALERAVKEGKDAQGGGQPPEPEPTPTDDEDEEEEDDVG